MAWTCQFSLFCLSHHHYNLWYSATRQACSVYLKNRLRRSYFLDPSKAAVGDQLPVLPSDRQALKSGIIPLLIASPSRPIKVQLSNALRSIISNDFPTNWPNLLDDTKRLLNSSEIREVETGLTVLLEIVKAFRCVASSPLFICSR